MKQEGHFWDVSHLSSHCVLMMPWVPIAVLYHSGDSTTFCSPYFLLFPFSPHCVFLLSHSWCLTTLGIYCLMASDHCLSLGVCLVLFFSFFNSTCNDFADLPCVLSLLSCYMKGNTGPSIQSWPLLLGKVLLMSHLYTLRAMGSWNFYSLPSQGVWWGPHENNDHSYHLLSVDIRLRQYFKCFTVVCSNIWMKFLFYKPSWGN